MPRHIIPTPSGKPQGACPDGVMSPLFGTNQQANFTNQTTLCSVRIYEDRYNAGSFYIEIDFRCVAKDPALQRGPWQTNPRTRSCPTIISTIQQVRLPKQGGSLCQCHVCRNSHWVLGLLCGLLRHRISKDLSHHPVDSGWQRVGVIERIARVHTRMEHANHNPFTPYAYTLVLFPFLTTTAPPLTGQAGR